MTDRQAIFALGELVAATRHLADTLAETAQRLHAAADLGLAERAILLELKKAGPRNVPDLARTRGVTRQATQVTVNALLKRDFVAKRPNPENRRSPLIALTAAGTDLIRQVMRTEGEALGEVVDGLDADALHDAAEVVATVDTRFAACGADAPAAPKTLQAEA